jgi:hypothetical protein
LNVIEIRAKNLPFIILNLIPSSTPNLFALNQFTQPAALKNPLAPSGMKFDYGQLLDILTVCNLEVNREALVKPIHPKHLILFVSIASMNDLHNI